MLKTRTSTRLPFDSPFLAGVPATPVCEVVALPLFMEHRFLTAEQALARGYRTQPRKMARTC